MIVLYLRACPAGVRGDVTKWLMEISPGIYVGNLSLRVREKLWQRICDNAGSGSAIMVCNARNEQGFIYQVHNSDWQSVDFDGITLMRRPLPEDDGNEKPAVSKRAGASIERKKKESTKTAQAAVEKEKRKSYRAYSKLPYISRSQQDELPADYVVLDTETTGLKPERDELIEVGCMRIRNGVVVDELSALINCRQQIPEIVQELTGLDNEILDKEGKPLSGTMNELLSFIGDDWIIGHNIAFDIRFIQESCARNSIKTTPFRAIDTITLSRELLEGGVPDYKLETLVRHFGIASRQTHRALLDARITQQLYSKLNEIQNSKR